MAETTAPAPDSAKEAKKPSGHRPDLATLGGLALALAGILGGLVLEQGKVKDVAHLTAAIIVLGGPLGAVMLPRRWIFYAAPPASSPRSSSRPAMHREPSSSRSSATPPRPARTASSPWRTKPRPFKTPFCARP